MAAREPTLPEGTDSIIDTNTDIGGGSAAGAGATGTTGAASGSEAGSSMDTGTGSASSGSGGSNAFQFEKGGSGGSGNDTGGSSGGGRAADSIVGQLKDQVNSLKGQAGDRARGFADDGKSKATDLLANLAQVLQDAASSVEERLGSQYAGFGNRAADAVSGLSSRIDEKTVDDLIEDAREFVRRSPAVAIGVAALIGFAVARVARSGVSEMSSGSNSDGAAGNKTGSDSAGAA